MDELFVVIIRLSKRRSKKAWSIHGTYTDAEVAERYAARINYPRSSYKAKVIRYRPDGEVIGGKDVNVVMTDEQYALLWK
jgi:hypothetical protein